MKDYQRFKLENGMTVILQENHSAPVVALQVWVKAGSADETDKKAGICHLVEHMVFKGTDKRKVGEIAYEIESSGGEINAYTSHNQTVYLVTVASRFFELGLDVLSDIVTRPSFDPGELENEKEVILEEIKREEDNPMAKLTQVLFSTCYELHPYRRPIIGFEDTVRCLSRDDLLDFYRMKYTPSNITLVVVGDVDTGIARAKVERAFKGFSSEDETNHERAKKPLEPRQEAIKSNVMIREVMEGYMSMAFHIPGIDHRDSCALDILSFILGNGESSRLFRKVKDHKSLVHSIGSSVFVPTERGLLAVAGMMDKENSKDALAAILEEIYRLKHEKVSEDELEKAKLNIESEFIYGKETIGGQARQLGSFEVVVGNVGFEKDYIKRISRVKSQDIMRVAKKHLNNKNLTVVFMLSHKSGDAIDEDTIKEIASREEKRLRCQYSRSHKKGGEEPKKIVLENGMTLLIKEDHSAPLVTMKAAFLGGLRFEEKKSNGVNNFMASMLTKGAKGLNALEVARTIESMAGCIQGFSGRDSFGLYCEILSRFFDRGLELFVDTIIDPTFDSVELEKRRADILAALRQQEDNLASYAFDIFTDTLYDCHPYGMNMLGTRESILNMAQDDLRNYYRLYATPTNMVLSIVGDVSVDHVEEKVRELFEDFTASDFNIPEVPVELTPETIKNVEIYRGKKQAHLILGFLGTTIYSPDRYPLDVLNAVLSGQGGRLFMELRDKLGLAYSVAAFFRQGIDPGFIGVYIGTSPEKLEMATEGIKNELQRVREGKVHPDELERAKRYLMGNFEIGLQTNSAKAATMALSEIYGLGFSHFTEYPKRISGVTSDHVLDVARKYIDLDRHSLAVIRPPK